MDYKSIKGIVESELIVKKSRFITHISYTNGIEETNSFISSISSKYNDATHNCYAYIANPEKTLMKCSDDKEPQGTAGLPMLDVLKGNDLTCITAVVTRYFGGHKLGVGGLVSAYSSSVAKCLEVAQLVEYKYSDYISIEVHYSLNERVKKVIMSLSGAIVKISYGNNVEILFACPVGNTSDIIKELMNVSAGNLVPNFQYKDYFIYK